jgi:hypothetical protein
MLVVPSGPAPSHSVRDSLHAFFCALYSLSLSLFAEMLFQFRRTTFESLCLDFLPRAKELGTRGGTHAAAEIVMIFASNMRLSWCWVFVSSATWEPFLFLRTLLLSLVCVCVAESV